MKIVNKTELGFYPNGALYSEIRDENFGKYNGDMDIHGLNIICGHDEKWNPVESGHFNGVCHFLNYISCFNRQPDEESKTKDSEIEICDTTEWEYDDEDRFVVFEKSDIEYCIKLLQ